MDEEVDPFDIHFKETVAMGTAMLEETGVVVRGLKARWPDTARLLPDTHDLFRARSVNKQGAGECCLYKVRMGVCVCVHACVCVYAP